MGEDWHFYNKSIFPPLNGPLYKRSNIKQEHKHKNSTVTACLLSYKRPENIQSIVDCLQQFPFIDEILVWNNNPSKQLSPEGKNVRVINALENKICFGRFQCAKLAKNELIYVQDDDAIVPNIRILYDKFLKNSYSIVHNLRPGHYAFKDQYDHFNGHVSLLGWGAFFEKSRLSVFEDYLKKWPEDYLLQTRGRLRSSAC